MTTVAKCAPARKPKPVPILPLFAWAEQRNPAMTQESPMAAFLMRRCGYARHTAIAVCEARGIAGEMFHG